MNILILNWRDPSHPLAGGAELSLLEHAKYWQKKGVKVLWFSSQFSGGKSEEEKDGIIYIRRGSHFTVHLHFFLFSLFNKANTFDKVIDCFHFLPFFTPFFIPRKKIIALINEVAGRVWFANLPPPLSHLGFYTEPLFFKLYRQIPFITASQSAKEDLLKVGVSESQITIIPHGVTVVSLSKKYSKEKSPTLLFLGRVSKDKGIKDVLEAYKIIKNKVKDAKLWIVGKEEKEGYLKTLLKTDYKKYTADITYFGFIDQEKKFELLKKSWLLLHASMKEGWGLTVIEAASQNTPTIGYNVEGLRDSIQHGKTGILVDPTPHALVQGVIRLLSDEEYYKKLSENAYNWSNNFDWQKSGARSWKLINK